MNWNRIRKNIFSTGKRIVHRREKYVTILWITFGYTYYNYQDNDREVAK